jgi:hypothetical protein
MAQEMRKRRRMMKIKTNVRAGSGTQRRGSSTDSSTDTPDTVYVPPVSRCVGI